MEKLLMHNGYWNGINATKYNNKCDGMRENELTYRMLADSISKMVLCNDITKLFYATLNNEYIEPELISGCDYDEDEDEYTEFYQYYIIGGTDWDIAALKRVGEVVYYIEPLDLYVWAISHWGTPWDAVSTGYELIETESFDEYMDDFYQSEDIPF